MNYPINHEIEAALLDVRKSYRLLHAYQTRILDLIKYISKRMGFSFRSGWPWYTDNYQKGGKVSLDNWAFDWLYMYLYEFNLLDQRDQTGLAFSVVIIPDTGFFDKDMLWNDRNAVNLFSPAEQSQSRLLFMAGKHKWHPGPMNMLSSFKKDGSDFIAEDDKGIFIAKSYPIANFINSDSVDMQIRNFIEFCHDNKINDFATI